jgi:hypothetical protein
MSLAETTYSDPRPASKIGRLRTALMYLIEEHRSDGALPTSVRFLFYELVARSIIGKEGERPDKIVSEALTDLRERGLVQWQDIVDETRSVEDFSGSTTVAEDLLGFLDIAQIDPWKGEVPFLLTESRSLGGVLRGLVRDYRGRLAATNGQVGGFLHTDVGPRLKVGDRVGYLGDLDLAGGDIETNTRSVLEEIVGGQLQWQRLALTRRQVETHNLPVIIKRDKRFKEYGERPRERVLTEGAKLKPGEHEAVETEALSQTLIVEIVRHWLDRYLPEPLERVLVRERRQRARLRQIIERIS